RYQRDAVGRVLQELVGGDEVRSRYGLGGQRERVQSSLGANLTVVRDTLGTVEALAIGGAGSQSDLGFSVRYARDGPGWERARNLAGGARLGWERDTAGRPVIRRQVARLRGGAPMAIDEWAYQWHGDDQLDAIVSSQSGVRTFHYDQRGRLVEERRRDQ